MTSIFKANIAKSAAVTVLALSIFLTGCSNSPKVENTKTPEASSQPSAISDGNIASSPTPAKVEPTPAPSIDLQVVKPDESGKIMVVMFHNFVESFEPSKYDKGEYTTTFDAFRKLLPSLYEEGYRLISMTDYLSNNISVPAGCIPMVFTFDDGTQGQFNLVNESGNLVVNKNSAVGIIEEFNKTHPDFGVSGTFYVNLGDNTFNGEGTLAQRLKYLTDKGFEIGNHTYTHINLKEAKDANQIQKEIGLNQKTMYELIPEYKMNTFSLPYGAPSKNLKEYVQKGEYEGTKYENFGIMEVGWDPTYSPVSKSFNPLSIHRVRASGINPVDADLAWWIKNLSREGQYISDGNSDTVTVPKSKEENVDNSKLQGKKIVVY
ncbi:polysaccharide deacetylase family protein [Acetivibrio cellulolyticus]|uniref:polysaccharide deacetylase family protein n=1 Tax=Acetivibrio cellulolyticus TaxID=35830 RepID=UPI0001E2E783|nr:polysaccharide deacetylase family protein [Acetivibrio cellulolyticus]